VSESLASVVTQDQAVPGVRGFAILAALDASVRGMMISAMPVAVYRALGDAAQVSELYFGVGALSLAAGLLVPGLNRAIPRRWLYTAGPLLYIAGTSLAAIGGPVFTSLALLCNAMATAIIFVCFNAYVLDYVARNDLGRSQSLNMFYAATPWAVGPLLGVWLLDLWYPAPFLTAGAFAAIQLASFWRLRMGDGKEIQKARGPAPNPLAYLGQFLAQPRLVAGWLFAVIRSCGWWVYVVYVPIFCIEAGLGDQLGGAMLSSSNAMLFFAPMMLRYVRRTSLKRAVAGAFFAGAVAFSAAGLLGGILPWPAVPFLVFASITLVMLDVAGGLPFLMAVKPSQRTEMAAVYSSFRDVSGILTPGSAWLVLLAAPVSGVFAVLGLAMFAAAGIATRLHPRLGAARG
jgi:MFS family permease